MVRHNLHLALAAARRMQRKDPDRFAALCLSEEELAGWQALEQGIQIPRDPVTGHLRADDSFQLLEPVDPATLKQGDAASYHQVCFDRLQRYQVIKQADTLLAMTRDTELGVVEMGASACGEIALLCAIAEPNFGLITNVGRAHLEGFGGVEGVRRGKGELYDYLAANGGRAFVRRDDGTLVKMAAERGNLAVELYDPAIADGVGHRLEGAFNRLNVAAAMAVGRYFGVDEERIRDAVAAYRPDNNRSQRRSTARNTLVVDCYNANPSSMQASLANFLGEESVGGKVAVLGDMLELGAWSAAEHRAAVEQALAGDVEQLWLVGTEFSAAWRAMGCGDERVRLFATCDEAAAALQASPFAGKFVLLKGSHGIGLERLIEWL